MAYQSFKTEEHAFKKIEKDIRTNSLRSPLFFYGRERYLIQWAISSIVEKFINPAVKELDYSKIDASTLTFDVLKSECETLPMLSEKRVIIVEDFELIAGNKLKGFSEEDEGKLVEYIKELSESCLLVFTATSADKRRKLYKTISNSGACYEFKELDEKLLRSFIEKRLKQSDKGAKPSVIGEFIFLSGYYDKEAEYTLYNLENDIKKAIAYSDGEEIILADITNTVACNAESNVFAMIDAISQNKKDEAFVLLHNLINSKESEYKLLSLICAQFETILMVKELKDEGHNYEEIQRKLGIHEYRVKKAAPFANRYSLNQLRTALSHAYQVDRSIKNGTLDARLALELLIAEL